MNDEPVAPQPLEQEWRRLHPFSPLLRGGLFLIVVAGIIIANMRDRVFELFFAKEVVDAMGPNEGDLIDYLARQSLLIWALVAVVAAIFVIIAISWLSWRFSTFRITEDAVESRRGVLFRQHRRAPLERIQSVNLQRSLLARIIGLTEVDVQTAGQGGKVALQYLGHRDAKEVREQILLAARLSKSGAGATQGAPSAAAAAAAGSSYLIETAAPIDAPGAQLSGHSTPELGDLTPPHAASARDDHGEHATSPAVDISGQQYAGVPGAIETRLRDLADFDIDPTARETGSLIKVPVGRLIASILLSSEMFVVLGVIAALTIASIWTTPFALAGLFPLGLVMVSLLISQFNRGFNFVLSRAEDGVRIGAGLTATTTETIPFGRVHAIEALQPLGWRPFGWWKVRITTAGYSAAQAGQNKMQNSVLPVGEIEDVLRVFETLLHAGDDRVDEADGDHDVASGGEDGWADGFGEVDGVDGFARASDAEDRRAALRDALIGAGEGFVRAGPKAGVLLWFGTRRAGVRIEAPDEDHASLRVRRGWLTRSLAVMPIIRAQSVQLSRPMVHHWLGLASVQVHTVLGPVRMYMRGIGLAQARQLFESLSETVVSVQSRDADRRAADGTTGDSIRGTSAGASHIATVGAADGALAHDEHVERDEHDERSGGDQ